MVFQFAFTTVFGWYAALLFVRTGHLAAPFLVHAFCNSLGFPRFGEVPSHPQAALIKACFGAGIAAFAALLMQLTRPALYGNALYDGKGDSFAALAG